MCVVSMVGDHYRDKWFGPPTPPSPYRPAPMPTDMDHLLRQMVKPPVSREEFDALRKEVEEMKALLLRAKEYDERNNEPHCEMEEKVALVRRVAEMVGVDLGDVFGAP